MRSLLCIAIGLAITGCTQDIRVNELPDVNYPPVEDDGSDSLVDDGTEPPEEPVETEDPVDEPEEEPVEEPVEDPPPVDDCEGTTDLIYVIDRAEEAIYTFDPTNGTFGFVGDLNCGSWEGSPASMAVGRDGIAYVRYSSNSLFAVDLETMSCSPTSYGSGFGNFGMGYATQNSETWRDDLYIANSNTLARVDMSTYAIRNVGSLPSQSELTGNADGELWAFLPLEMPARLVRLDKNDASVVESFSLPNFSLADLDTFAFANWGGEFYLFVRYYGMGSTTDVYKVNAAGQMSLFAGDTGMDVVGAGVSTCAPTQ